MTKLLAAGAVALALALGSASEAVTAAAPVEWPNIISADDPTFDMDGCSTPPAVGPQIVVRTRAGDLQINLDGARLARQPTVAALALRVR